MAIRSPVLDRTLEENGHFAANFNHEFPFVLKVETMQASFDSPSPALVRLVNLVGRGLSRIRATPAFDADRLLEVACRRTGLRDFGAPDPAEPLEVLCRSLNHDDELSTFGRMCMGRYLADFLKFRLQVAEHIRRQPDLAAREVERPIFISGLPRTGTTLLHHLMSLDPQAGSLRTWEILSAARRSPTAPPPPRPPWLLRASLSLANQFTPGLKQVHPIAPMRFEECTLLMMNSLDSPAYQLICPLAEYGRWCFERGSELLTDAYRLHRNQLHWLSAGKRFGHWVLKAPTHLYALQELRSVYPTAQIVLMERSPAEALASTCSLFYVVRRLFCRSVDPQKLGAEIGDLLGRSVERAAAGRSNSQPIFIVRYRDLTADPVGTIRDLYDRLGRALPDSSPVAIERWLRENPQHKHGVHRYAPEQYGIDLGAWHRCYGAAYDALFGSAANLAGETTWGK